MPIPGNAEPGASPGQLYINFSSAIPIKKRKFPIILPPSPSPEEKISSSEDHESKNKQESILSDEEKSSLIDARNTYSSGNSDVSKRKEAILSNIELERANVEIFASKPQEAKPTVSLNPVPDLRNKLDILSKEKSSDCKVKGSQTANVKQEIFGGQTEGTCGLELSTGSISVELSLGPKEPINCLEHKHTEAICHRSDKSDSSLLSLALKDKKLVRLEKGDSTADDVGSRICGNRSNWDLNTTMDVWEGCRNSDAFSNKLANIVCGFGKTGSCHDEKSSLTAAENVALSLNKGEHMLDVRKSSSSNETIRLSQQCKTEDSLGLKLALPLNELDARKEPFSLSINLVSNSASRNSGSQQVQLSAMNVNRTVKSEPVDENSRRDCSVGSSSSSNMGLLKLSSVKTEFVNNDNLETVMHSSISPDKFVNCVMKSEVVQKACKSEDDTLSHSVTRLMQPQESCASSSSSLLVPLMSQSSCSLIRLPLFSELSSSGNLSNHFENSFHNKELHDCNDMPGEQIARVDFKPGSQGDIHLRPCSITNSSVVDPDKYKLASVVGDTVDICLHGKEAADDDEKIDISAEMIEEESFESECGSQGNCAVDNSMDVGENMRHKEDEEYEDGEIREPLQCLAGDEPTDAGNETESLEFVRCNSRNLQLCDVSGIEDVSASDFDGKDTVKENREETYRDLNKDGINVTCVPNSADNYLQKVSDKVLEVGVDEKGTVSVSPDKPLDLSVKEDVEESPGKEISGDIVMDVNCGIGLELGDAATDKIVQEICSGENNSTLSKVEAFLDDHDAAEYSSNAGNKSRIINLSCAPVLTSPRNTKPIQNRLLTTQSGKEMYSDLDGETQPRRNRDEIYTGGGGSNKFAKDSVRDQALRNSRPSWMLGRGRTSGCYGSLRREWNSDYQALRRKHASDVEIGCNGYDIQQDDVSLGSNNRRTATNDEFHRTSLRRFSPGYRDGPTNRGKQTLRRFPRNRSPDQSNSEDAVGRRHGDKFMRHLSDDDIVSPIYNYPPQAIYDELDGQLVPGNRNFSTMQRKGYPRNRSKSPVRSLTRSSSPWSSPLHPSPALYNRMGRVRSPDRAFFRDEMICRRRGSPSYVARHPNDFRDVDVRHPRSANSNRRSGRRSDALNSDGDECYGDRSIDDRRKFVERCGPGPARSFRPSYNGDGGSFHFHPNDGPRLPPYTFCPDGDMEFVERGNAREMSRRIRNFDKQQNGDYRPVKRAWHDGGVKRRRF